MTSVRTARKTRKSPKAFDVAGWMAGDDALDTLQLFARKVAAFSRSEIDDLTSEIAVALLERAADAPATEAEFLTWAAEVVAEDVARKLRNADQRSPGTATDTDVMAETVAQDDDGDEPEFEFCAELVRFEKSRAKRIAAVLSKLSKTQRDAVVRRYFTLTGEVTTSTERMRLLRAKKRLASMMTSDGYALSV